MRLFYYASVRAKFGMQTEETARISTKVYVQYSAEEIRVVDDGMRPNLALTLGRE
jgi:hypothetical protein